MANASQGEVSAIAGRPVASVLARDWQLELRSSTLYWARRCEVLQYRVGTRQPIPCFLCKGKLPYKIAVAKAARQKCRAAFAFSAGIWYNTV